MTRIGIIAAMPGELKPLVQGWKPLPRVRSGTAAWQGKMGEADCIAVCAGMGQAAAERACTLAGQVQALVSVGWAGALSCGMQPGSAYVVNEVVDEATGERYSTASSSVAAAAMLKLVTIDHVVGDPAEKRKLGIHYRAVLVDMEAASVARYARARAIPFYCLKAVSDVQGEVLPDFSRYTDGEGQLRLSALLAHVALRPHYWPALARIGSNGKKGAVEIAAAFGPLMAPLVGAAR